MGLQLSWESASFAPRRWRDRNLSGPPLSVMSFKSQESYYPKATVYEFGVKTQLNMGEPSDGHSAGCKPVA